MPGKSTRHTYIIVDGYSLAFRAFYGTQFLSTSDGRPTNALFGLANMLLSLLSSEEPYGIVVAFDAPGKTFRHAEFPEYKAQRKEADPALKEQLPATRDLVAALGIPTAELVGFEADDLVGTIAKKVSAQGMRALVVTGDMDQVQLVDDSTTVRMTVRGITDVKDYTPESVKERFGFGPELLPDYKALRGDPSDNIPGVAGVGDKIATALIQRFGRVEEILTHLAEVEPRVRAKIEAEPEVLALGKRLTTIVTDAPFDFEPKRYKVDSETIQQAKRLFESLEFRTLQRRLDAVLPKFAAEPLGPPAEVREPLATRTAPATSPGEPRMRFGDAEAVALAVGEEGVALCAGDDALLVPRDMHGALAWLSGEEAPELLVHDGRAQAQLLLGLGVQHPQFGFDTQLAAYVLQPGRGSYELAACAREHLGLDLGRDAGSAAAAVWALRGPMTDRLSAEGTWRCYDEIDLPLLPILLEMERTGIAVDAGYLAEFSARLAGQIDALASDVYGLAGERFNIGSPKQLGTVLFEKLGLPAGKKTKTGYSTSVDVLAGLAHEHEIVAKVLSWRELTKLRSTYADALPGMAGDDGRIHTTFQQTVTATGRLSSTDPNLQNIPVKTQLGREIRRAFVAPPGSVLLSLDYSQIELRVLAHMCEDPGLVGAFEAGLDIHAATAHSLFGVPTEEVSSDQRRVAKMVNYAVLYGMSDFGLSQALGTSVGEAHEIIDAYFRQFPSVRAFTDAIIEEARTKGHTTTISGRRRYFPDIHSANRQVRMGAERAAINAPIQGSAADVIKIAMVNLHKTGLPTGVRMLLQVHDELVFECDEAQAGVAPKIAEMMSSAAELRVPLVVDTKAGPNWRDMD
jgi:DNA polymerase-1